MEIAVGSTNEVKIGAVVDAALEAFGPGVTVIGARTSSEVAEQPWGDVDTLRGAENRATASLRHTGADIGVGIEAGLVQFDDGSVESVSWVVAVGRESFYRRRGQSRAASYLLPLELADLVLLGMSLGAATRRAFPDATPNAGTVGPLTNGSFDRREHYSAAVQLALIPHHPANTDLTFGSKP